MFAERNLLRTIGERENSLALNENKINLAREFSNTDLNANQIIKTKKNFNNVGNSLDAATIQN